MRVSEERRQELAEVLAQQGEPQRQAVRGPQEESLRALPQQAQREEELPPQALALRRRAERTVVVQPPREAVLRQGAEQREVQRHLQLLPVCARG